MMALSNSEFAERVMAMASSEPFQPLATFDPDGDCIEFFAKPAPFHAERLDDLVTVYRSHETDEIVGSLIKGVAAFCRRMLERRLGMKIRILDGRVRLDHVFTARLEDSPDDLEGFIEVTYKKLIDVARETEVEVDLRLPAQIV